MDPFGAVVNAFTVVSQAIKVYRLIIASRTFGDIAGTSAL
jgi:hypothetical protein